MIHDIPEVALFKIGYIKKLKRFVGDFYVVYIGILVTA